MERDESVVQRACDDTLIEHLCKPCDWTHPLPFTMISGDDFGTENELEPELVDLMSLSDDGYTGPYLHYFPSKYKPSDPGGHKWLAKDLHAVGLSHGVKFVRDGGGRSKGKFPLVCRCGVFCRTNSATNNGSETVTGYKYKGNIKQQSLVNQRKNCRAMGATLPKKTRTHRPKKGTGTTCKARLTFFADQQHDRFTIHAKIGHRYHNNHHQVKSTDIPTGVNDLSAETVKLVQSMHEAVLNRTSIRNMVHQQSGVALNGNQIAYLKRILSDPGTAKTPGVSNKVNELISVLGKDPGIKFCLLFHDAPEHIANTKKARLIVARGTICCETYDGANQTKDGLEGVQTTAAVVDQADGAHAAAELIRLEHKIGAKGRLLLAIAWVTTEGASNFAKFPETLGGDTTFGTNVERRPLFLLVGKDSLGRSFVAFYSFLPHEKRFIFDWLFQEAIPNLLGLENCLKTQVILTDGDQTEISAVDNACLSVVARERRATKVHLEEAISSAISTNGQAIINSLAPFRNAVHRTCFYHLITQKLPDLRRKGDDSCGTNACWHTLNKWLNTLSDSLETWVEFQHSRRLLESWLLSKRVVGHLGHDIVHSTLEFLARSVFPHEKRFAGYVFQELATFDERTTSPTEGENSVIKAKGTGVKNNSSLADTTENILHNSRVRAKLKGIQAVSEWTSQPTWSDSPWSQKLTGKGEGLLLERLKSSSKYEHVRVLSNLWYVTACQSCYPPLASHDPVPRYVRTRAVEIVDHEGKQFIVCDCHRYNQTKISCGHVIHVLESLGVDLSLYHLAGIRWSTNYLMKYGALDTSEELRDAFERALQHPGVPFHPCTQVDQWTGGPPTFSRSGLTMSDFCPRSLGLPLIVYNYPQYTTAFLHHQQSTAMGANISQMVVTAQLFTSPVIGKTDKQHPLPQVTPESPVTQSAPESPFIQSPDWIADHHQDPSPDSSSPMMLSSQDNSRLKEKPAYFVFKDELADMSRLSEGHEALEDFGKLMMLITKGVMSGYHTFPDSRERVRDFSVAAGVMFSEGEPPSCQEALSLVKRVLLPEDQELHSFNPCVETQAQYTRKGKKGNRKRPHDDE
jgi:hypothetical protein